MSSGTKRRYSQVSNVGHMDRSRQGFQSETHGTTVNTNNTVSANSGQTASRQRRPAKRPRKQRRRKNEPEEDYSQIAREKTHNSRRTRQACDRCQARKLKCDRNPTGCGKCAQANLHCFSTDRTTGITFQRGQMERFQVENQQLRVENGQLRQQLLETTQQTETMLGILQQLGFQLPMANPPSQTISHDIYDQTNTQQSSQLLMQPMPPSHPSQQGVALQRHSQECISSPQAASTPYPHDNQSTSMNMDVQQQQHQQQSHLAPRRRSSQQQRQHVSQIYPTHQQTLQQAQEQEHQRRSLLHSQQVSPQVFQERSQAQASNMSYPPNDGGALTYPILPQPAASIHYDSRPSLSQLSGADAIPGSLPGPMAHPEPGGYLNGYTSPSGLMGLGGLGHDRSQVNTGGQNRSYDDVSIYASSSVQGLASDSTVLTSTWTMDGQPPQNSDGTHQVHDGNDSQLQIIGTTYSQQGNDNEHTQDADQIHQKYHGQQIYRIQKQQSSSQRQRYPEQTVYGRQTHDPRLSPYHEQQQTHDSRRRPSCNGQQQHGHEEIQQQQQQQETFLLQSNQDQDQPSQSDTTACDNYSTDTSSNIVYTTSGFEPNITSTYNASSVYTNSNDPGPDNNSDNTFPNPVIRTLDPNFFAFFGIPFNQHEMRLFHIPFAVIGSLLVRVWLFGTDVGLGGGCGSASTA